MTRNPFKDLEAAGEATTIDDIVKPAPKSVFILEAEAVEATLKLWLGLGLPSGQRVAAIAQSHLQEHIARLQQQQAKA